MLELLAAFAFCFALGLVVAFIADRLLPNR